MSAKQENLKERPPVVVVLGHVDHGKCVDPKTLIPLSNGEILTIEKIWEQYVDKDKIEYVRDAGKDGWITQPVNPLNVFSFDGKKPTIRRASYIWKLKAPDKMIEVKLSSGDNIKVTPEHPFFVFTSDAEIQQKNADSLERDDFIIIPQILNFCSKENEIKKRIIQRLGNTRNLVIFLQPKKALPFFKKLQKSNKAELRREGLISTNPYGICSMGRIRARDFVKLGQRFDFSFEDLYDMIDSLKNSTEKQRTGKTSNKIRIPKIPKDLIKLGYILGCLAGDGETEHGRFHNSTPQVQDRFCGYLEEVFGVTTKVTPKERGFKIENTGKKTLTRFLEDIADFPRKEKSKRVKFSQVFAGSISFMRGYIAGLFDTDGYASPFNYWAEFTSKSKDLIKEVSVMLLQFGIHSSVHKLKKKGPNFNRKRVYWNLRIANRPYLERFLKVFPIEHPEKKKKLIKAIAKTSVSRIFDLTPISGENLRSFYIDEHLLPYFSQYRRYKNLSRYFLEKVLKWKDKVSLPEIFWKPAFKSLINPREISCVKVEEIGVINGKSKFVYDLTIPKLHNFVAERMFVHNTAILDAIRETNIVAEESGGITQHIGAYEVEHKGKKITFIDTPGHEAFSAMRSRGAKIADIAVLVVAAEEGVKPQTKEAINCIKKAGIKTIVALNKIDKPGANAQKVKAGLSRAGIIVEELGGEVPCVETSATQNIGIDELLELILLVSELQELKADPSELAQGVIIETHLDETRGPIAALLIKDGTLKIQDIIATETVLGKVKKMEDFQGNSIDQAIPSQPTAVLGFESIPCVGEVFKTFPDIEKAKEYAIKKERKKTGAVLSVEEGQKVLNVILRADVIGTLEVIEDMLKALPQEEMIVRILKSGVGPIVEDDVEIASAGKAKLFGFRVKPNAQAQKLAIQKAVKIIRYDVIYELIQEVRRLMKQEIELEIVRKDIGKLQVLKIFRTEKGRQIVGGRIIEGEVVKNAKLEIFREENLLGKGRILELQRGRKPAERGQMDDEVGILYEGSQRIQEDDVLNFYIEEKKKAEL